VVIAKCLLYQAAAGHDPAQTKGRSFVKENVKNAGTKAPETRYKSVSVPFTVRGDV